MSAATPLLSLVLTLRPLDFRRPAETLPHWWGRAAHALLLDTVRRTDAALAKSLHDDNALKPFTASNLMGRFSEGKLDPQQTYTLRFTSLIPELSRILLESFLPNGEVQLDYQMFRIEQVAHTPEEHPWAGSAAWEELAGKSLLGGSAPSRRISLLFASPTTFRVDGRLIPLPLPDLVFNSLLQRWNSYAPLVFPDEVRRYAAECLQVSSYRLNSAAVRTQEEALRIGAVGQVTYTSAPYDRYWMSLIRTLAGFALYAGVGASTPMGLGQVRLIDPDKPPEESTEP